MVEVLLYLLKIHIFWKKRDDLNINSEAIQSLSNELTNNESKNIIFNVAYRPPDGICENYFKNIFFKDNVIGKSTLLAGDFNVNLLHFEQNKKVQNFMNLMLQFVLVLTTNKPTRITKDTISAIDHIIKKTL